MEMSHVCGRKADRHLFCFTSAAVLISFSQPPGYVMYQQKNTVLYILISFINDMNSQLFLMISSLVNFVFQKSPFCFCHTSAPVCLVGLEVVFGLQPFEPNFRCLLFCFYFSTAMCVICQPSNSCSCS